MPGTNDSWFIENWPHLHRPEGEASLLQALLGQGLEELEARTKAKELHLIALEKSRRIFTETMLDPNLSEEYRSALQSDEFGDVSIRPELAEYGIRTPQDLHQAVYGPQGSETMKLAGKIREDLPLWTRALDIPLQVAAGAGQGLLDVGKGILSLPTDIASTFGWDAAKGVSREIREFDPVALANRMMGANYNFGSTAFMGNDWLGKTGHIAGQLLGMYALGRAAGLGVPGNTTGLGKAALVGGGISLLATPGELDVRGRSAVIGAVGLAAGAGFNVATTRLLAPSIARGLTPILESYGLSPSVATWAAMRAAPHVTSVLGNAVGFTGTEYAVRMGWTNPDDPDVGLLHTFAVNLGLFAGMGLIHGYGARKDLATLKLYNTPGATAPGVEESLGAMGASAGIPLLESLATRIQEAGILSRKTQVAGADPAAAERAAMDTAARSARGQLPALFVRMASTLAQRGVMVDQAGAKALLAADDVAMDMFAALFGRLVGSSKTAQRNLEGEALRQATRVDPILSEEEMVAAATGAYFPPDLEAAALDSRVGNPLVTEAKPALRRLMARFVATREDLRARMARSGLTVEDVIDKWNTLDLHSLDFLQTYALFLEGQGHIGIPEFASTSGFGATHIARELGIPYAPPGQGVLSRNPAAEAKTARFLAKLPQASLQLRSLLTAQRDIRYRSEFVSALRMAVKGIPLLQTGGYYDSMVRSHYSFIRGRMSSSPAEAARYKAAYEEIERLAQHGSRARRLPDQVLVFRYGAVDPAKSSTSVSLDPRVALSRAVSDYPGGGDLIDLFETTGQPKSSVGLGIYLVPRSAILADMDTLQVSRAERAVISELQVDPRQMVPVTEIKFPVASGDTAMAMKIFPPLQQEIAMVQKQKAGLDYLAKRIGEIAGPVVAAFGKTPVLRLEYTANPSLLEPPFSVKLSAVKKGNDLLENVRQTLSQGGDIREAVARTFRERLPRGVKKEAGKMAAVVDWVRQAQEWLKLSPDKRKGFLPPKPPEDVTDPVGMLGQLRAAFGNDLDGVLNSSINVVGRGSIGSARIYADADEAAKVVLEAYRQSALLPPDQVMGMKTFATRLDAHLLEHPSAEEALRIITVPRFKAGVEALLAKVERVRDSLPPEPGNDFQRDMQEMLGPIFPSKPNWLERLGLFSTENTLRRRLLQLFDSGFGVEFRSIVARDAAEAYVEGYHRFRAMVGTSQQYSRQALGDVYMHIDSLRKTLGPEKGEAAGREIMEQMYALGSGKYADIENIPPGGVHPAVLKSMAHIKKLYESFEEAMTLSGFQPLGPEDGPYMTRMYKTLEKVAQRIPDNGEALAQLRQVGSRFFKQRQPGEAKLEDLQTDLETLLGAYIPSASRAIAYRPVTMMIRDILKTYGVSGKDLQGRSVRYKFGFELEDDIEVVQRGGVPASMADYLVRLTNKLQGFPAPAHSLTARLEAGFGAVARPVVRGVTRPVEWVGKYVFGKDLGRLFEWPGTNRDAGRQAMRGLGFYISTAVLAGVRPAQIVRNVIGGGLVSFFDPQVGPLALVRGARNTHHFDPATGGMIRNPLLKDLLADDTFFEAYTRSTNESFENLAKEFKGTNLMRMATVPFGLSEVMIRGGTAVGAHLRAVEQGLGWEDAIAYARSAARRTQADYSAVLGSPAFGSPAGALVGQFQRYSLNYLDWLYQSMATTGIFGRTEAAANQLLRAGPRQWMEGVLPVERVPNMKTAAGLRQSVHPMGKLFATALGFAGLNFALGEMFGIVLPDQEGILSPAPTAVKATTNALIRHIVQATADDPAEARKLAKDVAQVLGVDEPPEGIDKIAAESVGPAAGVLLTPLDVFLRWDKLSPREKGQATADLRILAPGQVLQFIRAVQSWREGFYRSLGGSRIGPEGRSLNAAERVHLLLGFMPSSVDDALREYEYLKDVRGWYDGTVADIDEAARDFLRAGGPIEEAKVAWFGRHLELQERLGVYRPFKELGRKWDTMLRNYFEGDELSNAEKERRNFPLDQLAPAR